MTIRGRTFAARLRLGQPWNSKAPFLITIPYFFFYVNNVTFLFALAAVCYSLCAGIGVAGLGYFSNDLADRKADLKAKVFNGTIDLSFAEIAIVVLVFLAAAVVPWIFYFPVTPAIVGLLTLEFLLLAAYSLKPFRLKERGFAGVVADALYAHAVPAAIAVYIFHFLTGQHYPRINLLFVSLVGWQFLFGLKSILQHQIEDLQNDISAEARTFIVRIGEKRGRALFNKIFLPADIAGFLIFTGVLSLSIPWIVLVWPVYALFRNSPPRALTDQYYLRWFPLVLLVALSLQHWSMIFLLAFHVLLFDNALTPLLAERATKLPVNPGDHFIWREPYIPRFTINAGTAESPRPQTIFFGFNRLGDFLCTTPVIRSHRATHPEANITYIVQDAPYCRLLEGNPDIDQVIYSKELFVHGEKILSERWLRSLQICLPSQVYRFNIFEVCGHHPRVFTDHITKGFASYTGIPVPSVRPVVYVTPHEIDQAAALISKPYIIFSMHGGSAVVGAGGRLVVKEWSAEHWVRLAKEIQIRTGHDIIAIGAQNELQLPSRYFRNMYGLPIKVVAALLKHSACVVTVENGISHLCHAVDAPIVLLYPRCLPFAWAFPREASACRAIFKDPWNITPSEVLDGVYEVLAQHVHN